MENKSIVTGARISEIQEPIVTSVIINSMQWSAN